MSSDQCALQIAAELRARLKELAWPLSPHDEAEVFHRVCDFADELKALGLPPERVIVAVNSAATGAGLTANVHRIASTARLEGADKLVVDMARWCIERFYGRVVETRRALRRGADAGQLQ